MDKRITCSDCPLKCVGTNELCESYCTGMADFVDEIKADTINELFDKVMQKHRTIIDDDGVMYKVVFLKDIEDMKAEVLG